jgi:uncharacterized protein YndB with AHSA1/START domain
MAASPEEVFAAWTSAESMEQWMHAGPTESARVSIDPRPGGALRIDMIGGGQVYEHRGEFLEVIPPRRLVFTWISKGTGQQRSVVTVEIAPHGAGSEVVLTHERLPDESAARAHTEGWSSILDGLSRKLAS